MKLPQRPLLVALAAAFLLALPGPARSQPTEEKAEKGKPLSWREIVEKYDRDGDGKLGPGEQAAFRKDVLAGKTEVPAPIRQRMEQNARRQQQARPARVPDNVTVERDVQYGTAGDKPLLLDMVLPKEPAKERLPLVVFIHGGGWRHGTKDGGVGQVAQLVATGNYVGASVEYRLTDVAIWPAQIHDCKAAIRWLRANAEKYHIDPERIAVWGGSAGGHLVSMLGTSGDVKELEGANGSPDQSSRVQCVVDFCGPSNFLAPKKLEGGRKSSAVAALLGGEPEDKQQVAREASPITYVTGDDPPFLIVHGTEDPIVPLEQAEMLNEALKKAGVEATFIKVIDGGHNVGVPGVIPRVHAFLEKNLRGQDVEVSAEPVQAPEAPARKPQPRR